MPQLENCFDTILASTIKKLTLAFPKLNANHFTYARIILTIPIVLLLWQQFIYSSFCLFIFANLLDILDGPIARKTNKASSFGAFLDPLADKILFLSVLITLQAIILPVQLWAMIIIEIFLATEHIYKYCHFRAEKKQHEKQRSKSPGKIKVWFEMSALAAYILSLKFSAGWHDFAQAVMLIAVIFACNSLANHLKVYYD